MPIPFPAARFAGPRRLAACALWLAFAGAAADPLAYRLGPGESPPTLDGRLDERAWERAAEHASFVQLRPVEAAQAPDGYRTAYRVVVTDDALFVGIRASDPDTRQIRAPLVRRDKVLRDQDFVGVVIDGSGTRRSAQFFRVNAAGVLADGIYLADGDVEDFAPDFDVEAAVARDDAGYTVELRLPLMMLRYPFEGGERWRIMVTRSVPRERSTLLVSAPLDRRSPNFIAELEALDGIDDTIAAARSHPMLAVRPEVTWRQVRTRAPDAGSVESELSLGAEIKWRPRADWIIDATLNPDFSQVDLDAPQLAGSAQFALSLVEKRPFFLESSDLLDLPLAAFYSRSVTDPRGGLRVSWRGPSVDAVALGAIDDGGGLLLEPGPFSTGVAEQQGRATVVLGRARAHRERATFGALASMRDDDRGRRNHLVGADVYAAIDGGHEAWLRTLLSESRSPSSDAGAWRRGHWVEAGWRMLTADWSAHLIGGRVSPSFRNDNGFVEQAGVARFEAEALRRLGERDFGVFVADEFELYLFGETVQALADGRAVAAETVARRWRPGIWWAGARGSEGNVELRLEGERARPFGRLHPTPRIFLSYGFNPAESWPRLAAEVEAGRMLDADADRSGPAWRWRLEARLRGRLGPFGWESDQHIEQSRIDAPGGQPGRLDETAWQWIGVLHLDARHSARIVAQSLRSVRVADGGPFLAGADDRLGTTSVVLQRRTGVGSHLTVGVTRGIERPAAVRTTEWFAKAAIAF